MPTVNIHTTIGPSKSCSKKDYIIIKRGATAILTYNLFIKYFSFEDIEQLTFLFKQGKDTFYYNLFDDVETKQLDDHFKYNAEENLIKFILSPAETKLLEPSDYNNKNSYVTFETAVVINTDILEELGNLDSTIIEQQPSICVVDTLYANTDII